MQQPTDAQLIRRAQGGSLESYTRLVERHQARLFKFLMVKCMHRQDAEDALQEAFLSAHQSLHSYNPRWAFSTWLFTIARRNLQRVRTQTPPGTANPSNLASHDDVEQRIDRANTWIVLKQHLDEAAYDAMWFHYAEDLPLKTVAKILQRSENWVKITLHRARKKLARCESVQSLFQGLTEAEL